MVPLFDELGGHLGEQGQTQHVLVGLCKAPELLAVLLQLRLQQVGRAAGDHVLRGDARLGPDLRVHLAGELAVLALEHGLGLLGEHLVPLPHDDVHHRLGAHDLAGGRHQGRIAEVLADPGNFRQHVVVFVLLPCLLQLGNEVTEHAAGDLIQQGVGVHSQDLGVQNARVLETLGHLAEMDGGIGQLAQVQAGVADGSLQRCHQGLGGGLAGAVGHRRQGGVHDVYPGIGRHQQRHVAGAGGVVGVQVDGDADGLLQSLHQGIGVHRQQEVGHVLDADHVRAHLLQLLGQLHEVGLVVDGGHGIAEGSLHLSAVFLGRLDGLFQIADVVESVENADDVDAVFDGLGAEGVHHVVGVVLIAQDVLAPEQHLQLGVLHMLADGAQALPGVLPQKAHTRVKGCAAPALQGVVPDGVQGLQGGQHILDGHAGGRLGLVGVPEDGIGNQQGLIR